MSKRTARFRPQTLFEALLTKGFLNKSGAYDASVAAIVVVKESLYKWSHEERWHLNCGVRVEKTVVTSSLLVGSRRSWALKNLIQ